MIKITAGKLDFKFIHLRQMKGVEFIKYNGHLIFVILITKGTQLSCAQ